MELIRISDQKIKIMLTSSDMCHFEIDRESFFENSETAHRAFRKILEEVRRKIGFEADDRRISVQYFPSREGGCEMFICNLRDGGKAEESTPGALTAGTGSKRALPVRIGKKEPTGFCRESAYRFFALDHLLRVCRRLSVCSCVRESAAYRDDDGMYYLVFTSFAESPFGTPDDLQFITEYGTVENAARVKRYIREHGKVLCPENAVPNLASLA